LGVGAWWHPEKIPYQVGKLIPKNLGLMGARWHPEKIPYQVQTLIPKNLGRRGHGGILK